MLPKINDKVIINPKCLDIIKKNGFDVGYYKINCGGILTVIVVSSPDFEGNVNVVVKNANGNTTSLLIRNSTGVVYDHRNILSDPFLIPADSQQKSLQMSRLQNGLIPPETVCPFVDKCAVAVAEMCFHHGKDHTRPFSCGVARAFDIVKEMKEVRAKILD